MSKYTTSVEQIKVNKLYKLILKQLGKTTINSIINLVDEKGNNRVYETSMDWQSKHNAEIDFLINIDDNIIPVEVKASSNTKSKSLKVYVEK